MDSFVSSINYCPVKSLSYQSINSCNIKKDLGMINDRIFAFSRGVEFDKAKLIEKNPNERKLNLLLTLKNSPMLNKYNFIYSDKKLSLTFNNKELMKVSTDNEEETLLLSNKLTELEPSLVKPILFLKNSEFK